MNEMSDNLAQQDLELFLGVVKLSAYLSHRGGMMKRKEKSSSSKTEKIAIGCAHNSSHSIKHCVRSQKGRNQSYTILF